jgi:hypothetical protein
MKFKTAIWNTLTLFVVFLLILNPETISLALFIDIIGLDIFLLLIELQVISLFWIFFQHHIKPTFSFIRRITVRQQHFQFVMLSPSGIMHLVVASSTLPPIISCLV